MGHVGAGVQASDHYACIGAKAAEGAADEGTAGVGGAVMARLKHPRIVPFYDTFVTKEIAPSGTEFVCLATLMKV